MIMREGKRNRETDTVQKQTRKMIKRENDYMKEIAMEFREKHTHEHTMFLSLCGSVSAPYLFFYSFSLLSLSFNLLLSSLICLACGPHRYEQAEKAAAQVTACIDFH